jgi:hypothetical protein
VLAPGEPPRADKCFCFSFADSLGGFLKEQRRELHRFEADAVARADLGRDLFKTFQGLRCKRNEPPLSPSWIRRPAAAARYPEAGLHVHQKLHRSEVAARRTGPSAPVRTEPFGILFMSSCVFIACSPKSRIAKYSSPMTRPIAPWRASRPILLQTGAVSKVNAIIGKAFRRENGRFASPQTVLRAFAKKEIVSSFVVFADARGGT